MFELVSPSSHGSEPGLSTGIRRREGTGGRTRLSYGLWLPRSLKSLITQSLEEKNRKNSSSWRHFWHLLCGRKWKHHSLHSLCIPFIPYVLIYSYQSLCWELVESRGRGELTMVEIEMISSPIAQDTHHLWRKELHKHMNCNEGRLPLRASSAPTVPSLLWVFCVKCLKPFYTSHNARHMADNLKCCLSPTGLTFFFFSLIIK